MPADRHPHRDAFPPPSGLVPVEANVAFPPPTGLAPVGANVAFPPPTGLAPVGANVAFPPPTGLAPVGANVAVGACTRPHSTSFTTGARPVGSGGFTMLELLTVLTIMLIVLSIASLAAIDWARTTGMRAATASIEAGLTRAREHAMTQRQPTLFYTANPGQSPAWFAIAADAHVIGTTNTLRRGIAFHRDSDTNATFTLRGSVAEGPRVFILTEPHRGTRAMTATIEVYGVTGHTEVSR